MEETKCEKLVKVKDEEVKSSKMLKLKKFFIDNYKMKLLVLYLIANILYIAIGSFMFSTPKINPKFTYERFSLGLRNLLVLNSIVFAQICFEKKYKRNYSHLAIEAVIVARRNFNNVCYRQKSVFIWTYWKV